MKINLKNYINNMLLPCFVFSALVGIVSALIVTAFKIVAEWAVHLSAGAYAAVRQNPIFLPPLVLVAASLGLIASYILSLSQSCRGGGIPTTVAAIRGLLSFRWISGIILLPVSALLSFMAGLPLGTEGPCVQMGACIGDGTVDSLGHEKHRGWRRYIMTGGASAGFSIATGSPISAIVFSMEELHKHFSPMLLGISSLSVISAQLTSRALASLGIGNVALFSLPAIAAMPLKLFYVGAIVGVFAGLASIFFTRLYHFVDRLMRRALKRFSVKLIFPVLFASISLVGFFFADALGTGHSLVESLLDSNCAWYVLILVFLVRAIGMLIANTTGATGGIFLPTLAFGAIIGALCAKLLIALGILGAEYYVLIVVLGISAFLGATSRIPLTACIFAVELLSGINNVLFILVATTVAVFVVEASGLEDLTDTIIEAKVHKINDGKPASVIEVPLTVMEGSFAVGKEARDVLWPNSCVVVSFSRADWSEAHHVIAAGDVITVRYTTYAPYEAAREFKALVGEQSEEVNLLMQA